MNQKGLSPIITIIVLAIIVGAGIGGYLFLKQSAEKVNTYDPNNPEVGATWGDMTVVSVRPFSKDSVDQFDVTQNRIVEFSGKTTISGTYSFDDQHIGCHIIVLDDQSKEKLPFHSGCLAGNISALQKEGSITAEVEEATLNVFPKGGVANEINVTKILEHTPTVFNSETANWKAYVNEKFGFAIKYPPSWFQTVVDDGSVPSDAMVALFFCPSDQSCSGQGLRIHAFKEKDAGYFDYPNTDDNVKNRIFRKGDRVYRLINENLSQEFFEKFVNSFQ